MSMRLRIMSDLHSEDWTEIPSWISVQSPYDYMIIAGDLAGSKQKEVLTAIYDITKTPIIFIPGNHDFYNASYLYKDSTMREIINPFGPNPKGITYLNNQSMIVDDYIFIGATLWWSVKSTRDSQNMMADFIKITELALRQHDGSDWGIFSRHFIEEQLQYANDNNLKAIVITHNAPSYKSVLKRFEHHPCNCFFVNDYDDLVLKYQPKLWIHGHIHNNRKYQIGETTVICNPYGYETYGLNKSFKPNLIMGV